MTDAIIIGKGPAGISAALYIKRAGFSVIVIGKDYGALEKTGKIENYYGFPEPISGKELAGNGIKQAKRLGIEIIDDEVTQIEAIDDFTVKTAKNMYKAKSVLLATGVSRKNVKIDGLSEFEGRGVSYCAVCDAFFYKKRRVAVLGSGAYALSEAEELLPVAGSVSILTNGEALTVDVPPRIAVDRRKIKSVSGNDTLKAVIFDDGSSMEIDGLFIAIGVAGSADFAKKLGIETENGKIKVDEKQSTNLPGLFAAGDAVGNILQIAWAVGEGARAGLEMIKYLRSIK